MIAANSAVKATAYLDFYQTKGAATRVDTAQGRGFMSRMVAMVSRFQCPSSQPVDKASDKASDKGGQSRAPKMSKLQCPT